MDPAFLHEVWVGIRFVLICMVPIMLILFGLFEWERRYPSIKQYPFRMDFIIQRGCPTVYQMVRVVIPARSLEQATEIASRIGNQEDTVPTFDPEFRL